MVTAMVRALQPAILELAGAQVRRGNIGCTGASNTNSTVHPSTRPLLHFIRTTMTIRITMTLRLKYPRTTPPKPGPPLLATAPVTASTLLAVYLDRRHPTTLFQQHTPHPPTSPQVMLEPGAALKLVADPNQQLTAHSSGMLGPFPASSTIPSTPTTDPSGPSAPTRLSRGDVFTLLLPICPTELMDTARSMGRVNMRWRRPAGHVLLPQLPAHTPPAANPLAPVPPAPAAQGQGVGGSGAGAARGVTGEHPLGRKAAGQAPQRAGLRTLAAYPCTSAPHCKPLQGLCKYSVPVSIMPLPNKCDAAPNRTLLVPDS